MNDERWEPLFSAMNDEIPYSQQGPNMWMRWNCVHQQWTMGSLILSKGRICGWGETVSINIFRHCGEERTPLFIVDSVFTMFSNACEAVKIYITKQHQHTRHTSQYLHLCAEIYRKYHLIGLSLVNIKSPSKSRNSTLTTMLPYN